MAKKKINNSQNRELGALGVGRTVDCEDAALPTAHSMCQCSTKTQAQMAHRAALAPDVVTTGREVAMHTGL